MAALEDQPPRWCVDAIDAFSGSDARSPERIAALTRRLAESGEILGRDPAAADVASTGGPASLTTFVPPLILAASGTRVPKIGVPGRPAGVIDTFGVIPGYKTALSRAQFEAAILRSGFGNSLSTGVFAPDDSILFRARQQLGAQNLPPLVVASLLSKKLAAGLIRVVFDVRTMNGGNFGRDAPEAHANIQLLQETATLVGIDAHCVVTDGQVPSQPMLGRAEALRGLLALLDDNASPWLERHFESCAMLARLADEKLGGDQPDRGSLRAVLDSHLRAQGADGLSAADSYLAQIERTHRTSLVAAPTEGRLSWDMAGLRTAIIANQVGTKGVILGSFPDACGVELLRDTGDLVEADAPVARVRGEDDEILRRTMEGVVLSMRVTARARYKDVGGQV